MIWHSSTIDEVAKSLKTDLENGLSDHQITERYKEFGYNQVFFTEKKSFLKYLKEQVTSSTFIIGMIAAIFYLAFDFIFMDKSFRVPAVIMFVLVCYVLIVAVVETLVNRRIISSSQISSATVDVIRSGKVRNIRAKFVVPGDIIVLKEGDYIPADARLISSLNLRCEETLITGSVATVDKDASVVCPDIEELSNRVNMIYSGCCVAFGECKAIVVDTGSYTERGKKMTTLLREEDVIVPIQSKIKKSMSLITTAFIVLSVIFFVLGMFIGRTEYDWREFVLMASLLFSVTVPCSYSLLVGFNLVMGMRRARRKCCDVKRIAELETICTTNVIICDKTGTLTQSRMKAVQAFVNDKVYDIDNFSPDEVASMLKIAALTCDGNVIIDDFGREEHTGDSVETAILSAAFKVIKTDKATLDFEYPRMGEIPLDSERQLKTVVCVIEGKPYAIVKGSANKVVEKCIDCDKESLKQVEIDFAKQAYRVIGIAYKALDELPSIPSAELLETDLTFSGFIAVANLPRFEAKVELDECNKAGIKTIMLTGDNLITATAAAKKLQLLDENSICVDGETLDKMSDEEFEEAFPNISVYADISPKQRIMIVKKWQSLGKTVAITGDSVSDAVAIKQADVGCAMGISGTQLAKSTSELIITDESYTAIVKGIKEIKGTYVNIRKSLKQFLSVSFGLAISLIFGVLIFNNLVITPMLILFAGLYFNSISSFSIAFEPAHKNILKRPIYKTDNIMGNEFPIDVVVGVIMLIVVSLVAYHFGTKFDFAIEYYFAVYVFASIMLGFSNKSERFVFTSEPFRNPFLDFAYVVAFITVVIMLMFEPAATFLKLEALKIDQMIKCFFLALTVPAFNELYKLFKKKIFK